MSNGTSANSTAPSVPPSTIGGVRCVLDNVGHRFGARTVFAGVSFAAEAGEVAIIAGANGAGKSTLLRVIAGLLRPTTGTITLTLDGQTPPADAARALHGIGYVAPDLTLYRELTGAENLLFFARLHGLTLTKDDLIARLTEVGLRGRGRDPVGAYSSGMRQRLKYAFARLADPPILLLDEPTANLDVDGVAMVARLISAQTTRPGGGLVILATNEPQEVEWGNLRVQLTAAR